MLNLIAALVVSASLMPPGKQMYLDSAGNPLSGGKVYTYAAGTSTPLATYSDQAGTTPNANPVVLNSRGEASIFWGAGPYKVTLRTSADALLWTQDNLYPPFTAAEPLKLYSGGNATTPELAWIDDTNSGFYLIGADNIGLSLGGTKRWDYAASGSTLTGTLTVSGAATLQSTLGVTGTATFTDAVSFLSSTTTTGIATFNGAARFNDPVTFTDPITVSSAATFSDPVTVGTATSTQHAATKAYVDASIDAIYATSVGTVTASTGWTLVNAWTRKSGKTVTLFFDATAGGGAAWASVLTVPAGRRIATNTRFPCVVSDASAGPLLYPAQCVAQADGSVTAGEYYNGTSVVTTFAIGTGDSVSGIITYVVD
jgi:hypothetical protein